MAFAMLMSVEVRGGEAPLPDLTKGAGGIDRSLTYNLGATGLRGWIYTKAADNLDAAQGRTTLASRQGSSPAPQHHVSIQTMSPNK